MNRSSWDSLSDATDSSSAESTRGSSVSNSFRPALLAKHMTCRRSGKLRSRRMSPASSSLSSSRVIVVPSSIMRSRIASVGIPPTPAPRMIRSALYCARLKPDGSTTLAKARLTIDAVRSSAIVASWAVERKGLPCRISLWMALVRFRFGCFAGATGSCARRSGCHNNTCYDKYLPARVKAFWGPSLASLMHLTVEHDYQKWSLVRASGVVS